MMMSKKNMATTQRRRTKVKQKANDDDGETFHRALDLNAEAILKLAEDVPAYRRINYYYGDMDKTIDMDPLIVDAQNRRGIKHARIKMPEEMLGVDEFIDDPVFGQAVLVTETYDRIEWADTTEDVDDFIQRVKPISLSASIREYFDHKFEQFSSGSRELVKLRAMANSDKSPSKEDKDRWWKRLCRVSRRTYNAVTTSAVGQITGQILTMAGSQLAVGYLTTTLGSATAALVAFQLSATVITSVPMLFEKHGGRRKFGRRIVASIQKMGIRAITNAALSSVLGEGLIKQVAGIIIGDLIDGKMTALLVWSGIMAPETPTEPVQGPPQPPPNLSDSEKLNWYNSNRSGLATAVIAGGSAAVIGSAMLSGDYSLALRRFWIMSKDSVIVQSALDLGVRSLVDIPAQALKNFVDAKYDNWVKRNNLSERNQKWLSEKTIKSLRYEWAMNTASQLTTANMAKLMGYVLKTTTQVAAGLAVNQIATTVREFESVEDAKEYFKNAYESARSITLDAVDRAAAMGETLNPLTFARMIRDRAVIDANGFHWRDPKDFDLVDAPIDPLLDALLQSDNPKWAEQERRAALKAAHKAHVAAERARKAAEDEALYRQKMAQEDEEAAIAAAVAQRAIDAARLKEADKSARAAARAAQAAKMAAKRAAQRAEREAMLRRKDQQEADEAAAAAAAAQRAIDQKRLKEEDKNRRAELKAAHAAKMEAKRLEREAMLRRKAQQEAEEAAAAAAAAQRDVDQKRLKEEDKDRRAAIKAARKERLAAEEAARQQRLAAKKARRDALKAAHQADLARQAAEEARREAKRAAEAAKREFDRQKRLADDKANRKGLKDAHREAMAQRAAEEAARQQRLDEDRAMRDQIKQEHMDALRRNRERERLLAEARAKAAEAERLRLDELRRQMEEAKANAKSAAAAAAAATAAKKAEQDRLREEARRAAEEADRLKAEAAAERDRLAREAADSALADRLRDEARRAALKAENDAREAALREQAKRELEQKAAQRAAKREARVAARALEDAKKAEAIDQDLKEAMEQRLAQAWFTKEMIAAAEAFGETKAGETAEALMAMNGRRMNALGYQAAKTYASYQTGLGGVAGFINTMNSANDAATAAAAVAKGAHVYDPDSEFLAQADATTGRMATDFNAAVNLATAGLKSLEDRYMGFDIYANFLTAAGYNPFDDNRAGAASRIAVGDTAVDAVGSFADWLGW